jgi:aminoglycoside phosphotransferase (APT) family kinase protein
MSHPELKDLGFVRKRMNKYLGKGIFLKRGRKLLNPGEKYKKVVDIKSLSHGLNNVIYDLTVEFKTGKHSVKEREFILRVYPENQNQLKADREAAKMLDIQLLDIPKAKLYFYENELKALGYRFLILEKLIGKPILSVVQKFSKKETANFLKDLATFLGTLHSIRSKKYDSYYLDKKAIKKMEFGDYILMEVGQILEGFKDMKLDKKWKVDIQYLFKWCQGHKPLLKIDGFSLIHGDVRASNIIVNKKRITGIIDWEMSCFSDPAQDLGWTLFFFKLYDNLKAGRGYFFEEYWKHCEKYDVEARVYFYEFLAALKIYTYAVSMERFNKEKYKANKDFFKRVFNSFQKYLENVTHRD